MFTSRRRFLIGDRSFRCRPDQWGERRKRMKLMSSGFDGSPLAGFDMRRDPVRAKVAAERSRGPFRIASTISPACILSFNPSLAIKTTSLD
jgi:hypothetical protein